MTNRWRSWKYAAITAFSFFTVLSSGSQGAEDSFNLTEKASQSSRALYESKAQESSLRGTGASQSELLEQQETQETGVVSQSSWSAYLSSTLSTTVKAGVGIISSGVKFVLANKSAVSMFMLLASARGVSAACGSGWGNGTGKATCMPNKANCIEYCKYGDYCLWPDTTLSDYLHFPNSDGSC